MKDICIQMKEILEEQVRWIKRVNKAYNYSATIRKITNDVLEFNEIIDELISEIQEDIQKIMETRKKEEDKIELQI